MTKATDFRAQTEDQLSEALGNLKREAFNLRFQAATSQLEKPSRVKEVRRDIGIRHRGLRLGPGPHRRDRRCGAFRRDHGARGRSGHAGDRGGRAARKDKGEGEGQQSHHAL